MHTARIRLGALVVACVAIVAGLSGIDDRTLDVTPAAANVEVAEARPTSHLPGLYACEAFKPHSGDYPEPGQQYWTNDGDGAYRCIYRHPQPGTDSLHYFIVCHDTYYWWWQPGLTAWVNVDCGAALNAATIAAVRPGAPSLLAVNAGSALRCVYAANNSPFLVHGPWYALYAEPYAMGPGWVTDACWLRIDQAPAMHCSFYGTTQSNGASAISGPVCDNL